MDYAWMITLQWTANGKTKTATRSGTTSLLPGARRNDVSNDLYKQITEKLAAPAADVLFFSLEPDVMTVTK